MIKADDLERWFEQQLLAGPMPEVDSVPGVQKPEPDKPTD
jgi:hypothetical protein